MPDIFTSDSSDNQQIPGVNSLHTSHDGRPKQEKHIPEVKHIRGLTDQERSEHFKRERESQTIHVSKDTNIHKLDGHSHNPLSAYNFYPDKVSFTTEDTEEKVVVLLRRHPITNLPWVVVAFLMVIAPSFSSLIPLFDRLPSNYQIIFVLIWYVVSIAFVLEKFLNWFFNVNLVTDERILDINFFNIMYREITEANVDEIQEVTIKPAGGIKSFFGYGDVLIQTAAEVPRIIFEKVPFPDRVGKILRELQIEEEIEKIEGRIR